MYKSGFVEKYLFDRLNVRKLLSVHKNTSSGILYSDVVKSPSNCRGSSVLGLNSSEANEAQSKTVRDYGKYVVNVQSKVSINDASCRPVISKNIVKNSEQKCVCSENNSRTGVILKTGRNNVNITEQDCCDFVHVNRFAVLCVYSSEDEGDSLDFDTVNTPDTFCTVRGCQGDESVGIHSNIGKIPSSFPGNLPPNVSECSGVTKNSPTKTYDTADKQSNRTTRTSTVTTSETLSDAKGSSTGGGTYSGGNDTDKYCLEIQSTVKGEKMRIAKTNYANAKCIRQNTPLFSFIPIYGLQSPVCDRKENNICQNIMDLHIKLRKDGRHNYVGLQVPVKSKLNAEKWASYLADYWDWQLPLLVKYGFPLDFKRSTTVCHKIANHNSATQYPDHVIHY